MGLLAAGQTNRGIAEALVLSRRTVDRHLANIYAKIGAHGRAEAAAYAVRHHLLPIPPPDPPVGNLRHRRLPTNG